MANTRDGKVYKNRRYTRYVSPTWMAIRIPAHETHVDPHPPRHPRPWNSRTIAQPASGLQLETTTQEFPRNTHTRGETFGDRKAARLVQLHVHYATKNHRDVRKVARTQVAQTFGLNWLRLGPEGPNTKWLLGPEDPNLGVSRLPMLAPLCQGPFRQIPKQARANAIYSTDLF